MKSVIARRVGEEGFVTFLGQLMRLRVLTPKEKRRWLVLHGLILRAEPPLDNGALDEAALKALARELRGKLGDLNA